MGEPTLPSTIDHVQPGRRPRILLVSDYLPQDVAVNVHGAFQRLRRHAETLQAVGDLDVIFLWPWHPAAWTEQAKANLAALRKAWGLQGEIHLVFSRFTCQLSNLGIVLPAWLEQRLGPLASLVENRNVMTMRAIGDIAARSAPDLIFAHRMGAILPAVRSQAGKRPIVIDLDDVEHVRMQREARARLWRERTGALFAAWLTKHLESEVLASATTALVCSEADGRFLRRTSRKGHIAVLPNAAPEQQVLPPSGMPVALFVGMVRYWPNAQGLIWLVRNVWPLVRRALPAARLIVAGLGSDELGLADEAAGIQALGFVGDLNPLYAEARIAICPLHIASGTRIKIIEAAMFGRVALSTTIGAEGLAFTAEGDIALANDAPSFARACIDLLGDPERCTRMGLAARETARRLYSPASIDTRLKDLCAAALASDRLTANQRES